MSKLLRQNRESGQGLVEYALILVLVSITVIVVLSFLGDSVSGVFERVSIALSGQTVAGQGTEYTVGGFSVNATQFGGPATCTLTVPSVNVTMYQDGVPAAAGQTVTVSASSGGGGAASASGTTNANGVATIGGITMISTCSGTVTITAGSNSNSSGY